MFSNANCSIFFFLTASQKLSLWVHTVFLEKKVLLKHLLVKNIRGTEFFLNYWNALFFLTVLVGEISLPVHVASFQALKLMFHLFSLRRSELWRLSVIIGFSVFCKVWNRSEVSPSAQCFCCLRQAVLL